MNTTALYLLLSSPSLCKSSGKNHMKTIFYRTQIMAILVKTLEVYCSAGQAGRPSRKHKVFSCILLRLKRFEKISYRTRMMTETISYVLVVENTQKEVWRNLSRYLATSQSHFSTEENNLDLSGL